MLCPISTPAFASRGPEDYQKLQGQLLHLFTPPPLITEL